MITVEEAITIIRQQQFTLTEENISYLNSLGRVLAEDLFSDVNFPPFNKSAMDGYACRKADLPGPLTILEEVPAGKSPKMKITEGTSTKIMTGAEVPEGADTVIMKEHVELLENQQIRHLQQTSGSNICLTGEDLKTGDLVLRKGTLLQSAHTSSLAGIGKTTIAVYRQPTIAVIATGSELVEPEVFPSGPQIRNSNGPQMIAQLNQWGFKADYLGIIKDHREATEQRLLWAFENHQVVILSGGISVGDYDYVPAILQQLGFELLITEIASKPGKHTIFARKGEKVVLGLPGNPVSAFVQMEIIGKQLLLKMMGHEYQPLRIAAILSENFGRRKADRMEFIPVAFTDNGEVQLLPYHGSAHIHALSGAAAIMEIPLGTRQLSKGEKVYVRLL